MRDKLELVNNKIVQRILIVAMFSVIAAIFIYVVAGEIFLPKENEMEDYNKVRQFESEWIVDTDNNIAYSTLPDGNLDNLYFIIWNKGTDIKVLIDDEERFVYNTENTRAFGNKSPKIYNFIKISNDDSEKQISIVANDISMIDYKKAVYGERYSFFISALSERACEITLVLLLLVLCFICVIFGFILEYVFKYKVSLIFISSGVLLGTFAIICNSSLRQMFFSNVSIIRDATFWSLSILPMPFVFYFNALQNKRYRKTYLSLNLIIVLNCMIMVVDYALFNSTLQFSTIIMIITSFTAFFTMLGSFVLDIISGKVKEYLIPAIGIFGLLLSCIIENIVLLLPNEELHSFLSVEIGMLWIMLISFYCSIKDFTKLNSSKNEAEQANQAKSDFLASMSHEIRTPINSILGFDEMIMRESREKNTLEYATNIRSASNTLLSLINDILDFSKIDSGNFNLFPVEYDLSEVIMDLLNMIKPKAKDKGLYLKVTVNPRLKIHLIGDEIRLRQIITNLLTNAVKYTHDGTVEFNVTGKNSPDNPNKYILYVSVKDSGIGIKKEEQQMLFESFKRLDEETNRNIEGTGLGLSITTKLLDMMDSELKLESEYGLGSEFYFDLEQTLVDDTEIGDFIERISEKDNYYQYNASFIAPDAKILMVDDNLMNLKVFEGLLKDTRISVDTTTSGKEALTMLLNNCYDIIFLDHMMPDMDGVETLNRMKVLKGNLSVYAPIIAISANAVSGAKEMYLKYGFDDYLPKPIQWEKLEALIKNYLPDELIISAEDMEELGFEVEDSSNDDNSNLNLPNGKYVDFKEGLNLSKNDADLYKLMIHTIIDEKPDEELTELKDIGDWINYGICVHSLKSNLATLGAIKTADIARSLETAVKSGNINFVNDNHMKLIEEYQLVIYELKQFLSNN